MTSDDGTVLLSAGRYAREAVLTTFEMIGGVERMAEWADENPKDFYTKLFAKTITREVESTGGDNSLDELVGGMIDVTPREVDDGDR